MRLMARICLAPSSTAMLSGVLSTTPPSRYSRPSIRTDGKSPGMAVEARRAGVRSPERNTAGLPAFRSVATTARGTLRCSKVVTPVKAWARSMRRLMFSCGIMLIWSRRRPEMIMPSGCAWNTSSAWRDIQTSRSIMVPASDG